MYERAHHPPVPFPVFLRRLGNHFAIVAALLAVSLAVGMFGFHRLAGYSWIDAFLDTAMLLGGMGPMGPDLPDDPAKLFAGFYALYAGLLVLVAAGVLFAPVVHRIMHHLHWREG
ncbi:MAG: hypothetical protein ACJ8AU_05420 [Gemmatimonadales bacterium]